MLTSISGQKVNHTLTPTAVNMSKYPWGRYLTSICSRRHVYGMQVSVSCQKGSSNMTLYTCSSYTGFCYNFIPPHQPSASVESAMAVKLLTLYTHRGFVMFFFPCNIFSMLDNHTTETLFNRCNNWFIVLQQCV